MRQTFLHEKDIKLNNYFTCEKGELYGTFETHDALMRINKRYSLQDYKDNSFFKIYIKAYRIKHKMWVDIETEVYKEFYSKNLLDKVAAELLYR